MAIRSLNILAVQQPDPEKVSAFECGFQPHGHAREEFELHLFY
jgi:NADH:ubiquinone oxidoreductase subunit 3 (subunit A)